MSEKDNDLYIAFGSCDIEDDVAVPAEDLANMRWQNGPYLEPGFPANKDWITWTRFSTYLSWHDYLTFLGSFDDGSFLNLVQKKKTFEVYLQGKYSHSRRAYITDFEVVKGKISDNSFENHVKLSGTFC